LESWDEYRRLVLSELERIDRDCTTKDEKLRETMRVLETALQSARTDIEMLKLKAGVWGFLAGFIPAAVAVAFGNK
jgi:hypothetical protein